MNYCGQVYRSLLLGRSRVTPLKKLTIPRLELTAATLAVRMSQRINHELDMHVSHIFWTDIRSVLGYIVNETTRCQTFVANRIAIIRDCTDLKQWKYIESKSNAADLASRGSMVDTHSVWSVDQWPKVPVQTRVPVASSTCWSFCLVRK